MKTISTKQIKENSNKINEFALESTEKVVIQTIAKTSDLQKFTAKQQDSFFKNAENAKGMIWGKLNKSLDFFSKN